MATITVGMVFHAQPEDIENILQELQQRYGIRVLCVKQSWGKIWLKEGDSP